MSKENEGKGRPAQGFTVDTHLFRELGELLVGRDSTALVELIKNSYDADATEVTVHATGLDDPETASIVIKDDGLGMTGDQFHAGFLRIASRSKEQGDRRSPRFKRRFTGAKGVGRLAAHKLAKVLHVNSVATDAKTHKPRERVVASIDWVKVEAADTLDKIAPDAVIVTPSPVTADVTGGTTITLTKMRRRWTARDIVRFVLEARATIPPSILKEPFTDSVVAAPLLFAKATVATPHQASPEADPGWDLDLLGDFDVGEQYWQTLANQASWVVEIDVTPQRARYVVAPTKKTLAKHPELEPFPASIDLTPKKQVHPEPEHSEDDDAPRSAPDPVDLLPDVPLSFQARILIREGAVSAGQLPAVREWIQETHGIRVYMEGFRVLPYGESGDDWLRIDRAYAERSRAFDQLSAGLVPNRESDENLGLTLIPNRQYLGAVFLTTEGASSLRMLVNREGFVPDPAFVKLQDLVIAGIGLATRIRAAASAEEREERRKKRAGKAGSAAKSSTQRVVEAVDDAIELAREARTALAAGKSIDARTAVDKLEELFQTVAEDSKEIADEQAMIRVLASLGARTSGFVHEINGLLGLANALEKAVRGIRDELTPAESKKFGSRMNRVSTQLGELKHALERQASYLTEIVTPDKRRRRSPQELRKRFDAAAKLIEQHAEENQVEIRNNISADLRTPRAMFASELVAVFTNLLTNAVKAVGSKGEIRATARDLGKGVVRVLIENTGKRVAVNTSEKWFRPFTSTTQEADPVLGLGMGLGLPITRRILDEYGAIIQFVEPSKDFSTAIEIRFEAE